MLTQYADDVPKLIRRWLGDNVQYAQV